jgi:hypothetical protein
MGFDPYKCGYNTYTPKWYDIQQTRICLLQMKKFIKRLMIVVKRTYDPDLEEASLV